MTDMTLNLDPETLVAYVDKELTPEQAAAVEAALMHDAAARESVRLLRQSSAAAAHAFDGVLNEPLPGRLLLAAGVGAAETAARPRLAGPGRARRWAGWTLPLAASLAALALGLAGGYELRGPGAGGGYAQASATAADPLANAFESTLLTALDGGRDGDSFAYAGNAGAGDKGRIELGAQFTTGFGTDCREFRRIETRAGAESRGSGLACRGPDRSWSVMLLAGTGT
jgi:surface antigen